MIQAMFSHNEMVNLKRNNGSGGFEASLVYCLIKVVEDTGRFHRRGAMEHTPVPSSTEGDYISAISRARRVHV